MDEIDAKDQTINIFAFGISLEYLCLYQLNEFILFKYILQSIQRIKKNDNSLCL